MCTHVLCACMHVFVGMIMCVVCVCLHALMCICTYVNVCR